MSIFKTCPYCHTDILRNLVLCPRCDKIQSDELATTNPLKVHVQVTENDIRLGTRYSPGYCPIARACRRAFNAAPSELSVNNSVIEIGPILLEQTYSLPHEARIFIRKFDLGRQVHPIEFDVCLIDEDS